MLSPEKPCIIWFRRDLRLADNQALQAAIDSNKPIIPLFILEGNIHERPVWGAAQLWWLHHSLLALSAQLNQHGSKLILILGDPNTILTELIEETEADAVFWNRRYDAQSIELDSHIKARFTEAGLYVKSFNSNLLHEPSRLKTKTGNGYRVYTPFWNAINQSEVASAPPANALPEKFQAPLSWPSSDDISDWKLLPSNPDWAVEFSSHWTPGELSAHEKLEQFKNERLHDYEVKRDIPASAATSELAPHLAFGEISPRSIWNGTEGLDHTFEISNLVRFRKEIVWREFNYHLLYNFPDLAQKNWNPRFDEFEWLEDEAGFEAWTKGQTGYPIVDAGMRQLWRHGTMHNRVRMITASFLIKHLLIDWRKGEKWFYDTLLDADPASNPGNWQWVAGSGADASPFFRIFNPILQGQKFDPDGEYVKAFVPELSRLSSKYIHWPKDAPIEQLRQAGIILGQNYPSPIIDHKFARERALSAFSATKSLD